MVKSGPLFQLSSIAALSLTTGRLSAQGIGLFWGTTTSAIFLSVVILAIVVVGVAFLIEALISKQSGIPRWELRSYLFVLSVSFIVGLLITGIQIIAQWGMKL